VAVWRSQTHLDDHFALHGRALGCDAVEDYDASAQRTLDAGIYFTYTDDGTEEDHTGCFDPLAGRFVALDPNDRIVTHFACDESYIRRLLHSNYDG